MHTLTLNTFQVQFSVSLRSGDIPVTRHSLLPLPRSIR